MYQNDQNPQHLKLYIFDGVNEQMCQNEMTKYALRGPVLKRIFFLGRIEYQILFV